MKCWKCGSEIATAVNKCIYCGAIQNRTDPKTEPGKALRLLYDRYGAETVFINPAYIVNGLGDLLQDAKKIRNQFRLALQSGAGSLYLEQIRQAGKPDDLFNKRIRAFLMDDAGLGEKPAEQIALWFDEMIGWNTGADEPQTVSKRLGHNRIIGIDLGTSCARAAVIEKGQPTVILTGRGEKSIPCTIGIKNGDVLIGKEAQIQAVSNANDTVSAFKRFLGSRKKSWLCGQSYSPQFLSAMMIRKVCLEAGRSIGGEITEAVVTVPNGFTYKQRKAIIEAGKIAGVEIKRVIGSSTAAALAYGYRQEAPEMILVCDLGGGYLDVSLLRIGDGVVEVLSSASKTIGGIDFDDCIAEWLIEEFKKREGIDLHGQETAVERVKQAAENAKKELSEVTSSHIYVPYLVMDSKGMHHLDNTITRTVFNNLTNALIKQAKDLIQSVIAEAAINSGCIDRVILTGSACRITAFRQMIKETLGKEASQGINPDDCTALGAAVLGGMLEGDIRNALLLDATAHSLGIETAGGVCTRLITKNTTFPVQSAQLFSTFQDNQSSVEVSVLEGESDRASENIILGSFILTGIPPAKKGVPKINVCFSIEADGTVSVTATETLAGKQNKIDVLTADAGMSLKQITAERERVLRLVSR